jgi:thymidine kinase
MGGRIPAYARTCMEAAMAKLYFYYSAMNAGKSTTLLQSEHNYREQGMRTLCFTPRIDDRAGVGRISSRIGLAREATPFTSGHDLFVDIRRAHAESPVHCVLIDEAQFLSARQVLQLTLVVDRLHIPVLCYGLRTDFRGEPFEGSKYLLAWAEEIVEIKTVCRSGRKATMNARLDKDGRQVVQGNQIDIGHHYEAVSRASFGLDRISPVGYSPPPDEPVKATDT